MSSAAELVELVHRLLELLRRLGLVLRGLVAAMSRLLLAAVPSALADAFGSVFVSLA